MTTHNTNKLFIYLCLSVRGKRTLTSPLTKKTIKTTVKKKNCFRDLAAELMDMVNAIPLTDVCRQVDLMFPDVIRKREEGIDIHVNFTMPISTRNGSANQVLHTQICPGAQ